MTDKEKLIEFVLRLTDEEAELVLLNMAKSFISFLNTPPSFENAYTSKNKEEKAPFRKVVYSIKNTANGKEYIGMTGNYDGRIKHHMSRLKNGSHFVEDMQSDFNKDGNCFIVSVLEEITSPKQRRREFELIESHKSYIRGNGYNYKDRIFSNWKAAKERAE